MYSPVTSELSTPSSDKMNVSPTPSKAVNEIYSFIDQLKSDKKRTKNILSKIDSITAGVTGSKLDLLQAFNNFNNFGSDSDSDKDSDISGVSSDEEYVPVKKSVHDIPLLKRIAEIKEKNKLRNSITLKSPKEVLVDTATALLNKADSDDSEVGDVTKEPQKQEIHHTQTVVTSLSPPRSVDSTEVTTQEPSSSSISNSLDKSITTQKPSTSSVPFTVSLWPFASDAGSSVTSESKPTIDETIKTHAQPFAVSLWPFTSETVSTATNTAAPDSAINDIPTPKPPNNTAPFAVSLWPFTSDTTSTTANGTTVASSASDNPAPQVHPQDNTAPFVVSLWPFTSDTTSTTANGTTVSSSASDNPAPQVHPQDNTAPFAVSLWPFTSDSTSTTTNTTAPDSSNNVIPTQEVQSNTTPFVVSIWPFTSEVTNTTSTPEPAAVADNTATIVESNDKTPGNNKNPLTIMSNGVGYLSSAIATNALNIVDISADATEFATMYVIENTPILIEKSADNMLFVTDSIADAIDAVVFNPDK